jgi:hypothetical protein
VEEPNKMSKDFLGTVRSIKSQKIPEKKTTFFLKVSSPAREIPEKRVFSPQFMKEKPKTRG